MGEGIRWRRIGEIVRGHVDGLERGDRTFLGRGNALLEQAHFVREGRLITDRRRRTSEQRGYFRASLRETENIVDEQKYVLVLFVAKIFRHRERRKGDAHAGARRLVHLAVNERDLGL